jgi:hypothetical protein
MDMKAVYDEKIDAMRAECQQSLDRLGTECEPETEALN